MKKFTATMNDGSFINVEATKMVLVENMIHVYDNSDLVALVDIGVVLNAYIGERGAYREQ